MFQVFGGIVWGVLSAVLVTFGAMFAFAIVKHLIGNATDEKLSVLGWVTFALFMFLGGITGIFGIFALGVYLMHGFAFSEDADVLAKIGFGVGCFFGLVYGVFWFKTATKR